MSREWTTPDEVTAQVRRHWESGRLLAARLTGESLFPMQLRFVRPSSGDLSHRFGEVREWLRALEQGSRSVRGFGYEIEWVEQNARITGRNRVPAALSVPAEADALRLIGAGAKAERFDTLASVTLERFPSLRSWIVRRPLRLLEHAEEWDGVLATLHWFQHHPRSNRYLRELDIEGVDTKFIQARRGILTELLDLVLPADQILADWVGVHSFEARYGLRSKPALVRFRLLDERCAINGLTDIATPAEQFARLKLPVRHVFITENEINGLVFPDVPESIVIFGLGYDVERLRDVAWLSEKNVHYWGDLDTHGFAILNRLRTSLPRVRSFLMDHETLVAHRAFWGREASPFEGILSALTTEEQAVYQLLRSNALGHQLRLEQERIPFGWVVRAVAAVGR